MDKVILMPRSISRHIIQPRFITIALTFLLLGAVSSSAPEQQQSAETLFGLIDQRLSLMEEVAIYKAQHDLPIEDKARERLVLQKAVEGAVLSGIDRPSSEAFFRAQIEAAKSIQRQVLKERSPEAIRAASPRDLIKEIRPRLIELGTRILRHISDYLVRYDAIDDEDYSLFQETLSHPYLSEGQRRTLFQSLQAVQLSKDLPEGFVDVTDAIPTIHYDLRYLGDHNFTGTQVDGYFAKRLMLTKPATAALARVQAELERFGLGLLVYDAYRPQRAVDHFVRWAEEMEDTETKDEFYPDVPKSELFARDYIARRSSHTRGSTVDLTIVIHAELDETLPLDMGSPYDFFGPVSWPEAQSITPQQRANRLLLRTLMAKHGFQPYAKEWWHFTLINEPFPETYFDFPITE